MLPINPVLKERLILFISCLMVAALFVASYPSASLSIDPNTPVAGEHLLWPHAPFLLSISMGMLFVFTFLTTPTRLFFSNFFSRKDLLALSFVFIYLFAGFINSAHYDYLFQRLQIKLPFLLLPVCAASISLSKKSFHCILLVFVLCTFIVGLYTFGNYLVYYAEINAAYLKSKVMPTPMNHVRYSILAALAVYTTYYLVRQRAFFSRYIKAIIIFAGIFLFIFIHLYSVRSGILALYAIVCTEIGLFLFKKRAYKKGLIALSLLFLSGLVAMSLSPTLKNKLINTQQDLNVYRNSGTANANSLSTRFVSYENAVILFKESPLLGCGLGDLELKNNELFQLHHPDIADPIIPHNEFLYYLAGMGIIGAFAFIFSFFYPLVYQRNYRNEFLLIHYIVLFLSFQTEPMIETQLGVACTLLFIIFPLTLKKETLPDQA